MSTDTDIQSCIDSAAETVGSAWPLHSFVTANPLAGLEDRPFPEAVAEARRLFGGQGYPSADTFETALEQGQIDPDVLRAELRERGYTADPETLLAEMETDAPETDDGETPTDAVDQVMSKWLTAFCDEGKAAWPMPNREDGFYDAVRSLAPHDGAIPDGDAIAALPEDPLDAVAAALEDYPEDEWDAICEQQLTALPGWTGLLKQRAADGGPWQSKYPITLSGYLAIRLHLAAQFDAPLAPEADAGPDVDVTLCEAWLSAWERTYREDLVETVAAESPGAADGDDERPAAQLVFCIDTRSEIIRRHIEAAGPYDTHGYAGFFGVPMRYQGYGEDVSVDACPPIVDAQHRITDRPAPDAEATKQAHDRWSSALDAGADVIQSLKKNATTAFSFVESSGGGYGLALAARTLLPSAVYDANEAVDERVPRDHEFCEPSVDYNPDAVTDLREGLTLDEKVEYAATAFDLMGWETFGRLVVFTGHASETANNPFGSSLDCGACAGNPGGPSARVLASICNEGAVKAELRERGHEIPEDTVFLAGQHNTTTDEVELYDGAVPESHQADLKRLRADLDHAQTGAAAERASDMGGEAGGVRETQRRAADWAETRPEWGLAGNAAFVVGPRDLTEGIDLDGRSFLHSYDWTTDDDGSALEAIVAGPMVVTQWINSQYYFATVDTAAYGSGSKVTQNPVGNVGVVQGNGGDIMTGLPLQSVMAADDDPYHQPLRLSTVIHAPLQRVSEILSENEDVATLLDNGWLSLTVVDPQRDHRPFEYVGEGEWEPLSEAEPPKAESEAVAPAVADD